MKQIYTLIALTLVTLAAQSRTINTVTASGNWSDASSWSLNRVPQDDDSVVVPAGMAIVFDRAASFSDLYINVSGSLTVKKTMTLDNQSVVRIATGGQLNRWAADVKKEVIVLGGVDKFDQTNASSINGFGIASSLTGIAPNGFSLSSSSLPVTFSSFYATKSNNDVVLTWSTAQELNNNNFEIQRSTDGSSWNVIAVVMGMGTTNTSTQYKYTDKNSVAATVYYRIRQVDFDGNFDYSTVKVIRGSEASPVTKVYASVNNINIEFNKAVAGTIVVRVLGANGQLLAQQSFGQATYRITMNANSRGAGLYVVQVTDGKGWSESTKIFL